MLAEKSNLHPRNVHRNGYNFTELVSCLPDLKQYVFENKYGNLTINFSIPKAVKLLNKALLLKYYHLENWDIPKENLCPPIPGRADYLHYIADLLAENQLELPFGSKIKGLDIGTGANLIYPIIASQTYGWQMVATDVSQSSLENAQCIIDQNSELQGSIQLKHQVNNQHIFKNMITENDTFLFSMCNPPFFDSEESALKENLRKTKNLNKKQVKTTNFNFAGSANELWCKGGELAFILNMIKESTAFASQILWFTSLVSKKENLLPLKKALEKTKAKDIRVIEMSQGQKNSRILAWSFIPTKEKSSWFL